MERIFRFGPRAIWTAITCEGDLGCSQSTEYFGIFISDNMDPKFQQSWGPYPNGETIRQPSPRP